MPDHPTPTDYKDQLIANLSARLSCIRNLVSHADSDHISKDAKKLIRSMVHGWKNVEQTIPIYTRK